MTGSDRHQSDSSTTTSDTGAAGEGSPDRSDPFAEMPPSAKLVHFVLDRDDDRTQTELVEETALSARTVRTALRRLEDAGLVTESVCLRDARKRVYSLDSEDTSTGEIEAEA